MRKLIIVILLLVLTNILFAQELTLEQAKLIAINNYPELKAQKENFLAAKSDLWNSMTSLLPSVNTTATYTDFKPNQTIGQVVADNSQSYGYTITQPIFQGGKIWLNTRIKNDLKKIAEENYRSKKLETLANVEEKYFSVLESKQLLKIAKLDLKSTKKNLEIAKSKFEAGILSKADYLQIKAEKSNKEVSLLQSQNLYETNLLSLGNYLQLDNIGKLAKIDSSKYSQLLSIIQSYTLEDVHEKTASLLQVGLEFNPVIKISEISLNTNKKSVLMAEGNFLPSVNFSYSKNFSKYDFMDDYDDSGNFTVSASLPLFPIVDNTTSLASSRHNLKKSKHNLTATKDGIELAIKNSFLNLVTSAKSVKSAKTALEQSEETYNQMQRRFSMGQISANDLLATQTMLLSAENQFVNSLYKFLTAKSSLLQQIGKEDDTCLTKIIKNKSE